MKTFHKEDMKIYIFQQHRNTINAHIKETDIHSILFSLEQYTVKKSSKRYKS